MVIEQNYCQYLKPGVARFPDGKSRVYLSEFYEYFSNDTFRNFSIKYPVQGKVVFKTGRGEYDLRPGSFLLSSGKSVKSIVESKLPVRWISIDIQEETISEAIELLIPANDRASYNIEQDHFLSDNYFENLYPLDNSDLGKMLNSMATYFNTCNKDSLQVNDATFLKLALLVVERELANQRSLHNLSSIKNGTKKETLKRLLQAKNYIDEYFLQKPGISVIARHCNLSSFHFLRSFKLAFSCSPYQYMLQKRMEHALSLLKTGTPVTQIASACSFSDLFTFSKAFKKFHGVSPSKFLKRGPAVVV